MDINYLLTADEMIHADAATIAAGTPGEVLMERAAAGVVKVIEAYYSPRKVLAICGSGNNGRDAKIAAEILRAKNWEAGIVNAASCEVIPADVQIIIDGVFGTGLDREISGQYANLIKRMNEHTAVKVAVDIPSGVNASTGEIMGVALKAEHTITFAAAKCGHYLLPGKMCVGQLHLTDIGVTQETLKAIKPMHLLNNPALWRMPELTLDMHKYDRGYALVMGGDIASAGAAKLSANAALKMGAGMVGVICDESTLPIYAESLMAVMTKLAKDEAAFDELIQDERCDALLIGPGAGRNHKTLERSKKMLANGKSVVLDADALCEEILPYCHEKTVITPHGGEFCRMFQKAASYGDKLSQTKNALKNFPGVLVYKGNDTVISQRSKPIAINGNAPPSLATAGAGDVLAGMIVSLMAQGMEPFEAACAAVWLHGETASQIYGHYTAENLISAL